MKKWLCFYVVFLSLISLPAFAEPTISEVYAQAAAGHIDTAQTMMKEVLKSHPQSAKAHFIEAELLTRQGQIHLAREHFELAQKINPALDFARPESVQKLRRALTQQSPDSTATTESPFRFSGWIWPIAIGMLIALIWSLIRSRTVTIPQSYQNSGSTMPYGLSPTAPGYPQQSNGPSLLSSLATGAAIGGGIVAGEALAHRLLEGETHESNPMHSDGLMTNSVYANREDVSLGGDNFGVTDAGDWDNTGGNDNW